MADVFVSYHKQDRAYAEAAVASLTAQGYSVWWDDRVTPMETWDKIVEREIAEARCVLVLWTRNSVDSDWVRIEANFAKMARPAKLVQVRLEECDVPINFSLIQYADAFEPTLDPARNPGWARALEWVGLFVGARPAMLEEAPPPKPRKRRAKRAAAQPTPPPAEAAHRPEASVRPIAAPIAAPAIDVAAMFDRGVAGVSRLFAASGFYSRAIVLAAIGAIVGALLYGAIVSAYVDGGPDLLRYLGSLSLRLAVGAGVAFALWRAGRLDPRGALILVIGYAAGVYTLYRALAGAFALLPSPPSEATASFIGDVLALAALWLIARFLGAMTRPRRWLGPILTSAAVVVFAFGMAAAIDNEMAPSPYEAGTWAVILALSLFLEALVLLTLLEPVRAAGGEHGSVNQT